MPTKEIKRKKPAPVKPPWWQDASPPPERRRSSGRSRKRAADKTMQLTPVQKRRVLKVYEMAILEIDHGEIDYVLVNAIRKVSELPADAGLEDFVQRLQLLFRALADARKGEHAFTDEAVASMAAALLYVIMPFDVIPDKVPKLGYLDDILVVEQCLDLVASELRSYCAAKGLNPGQYDLA